MGWHPIAGVRRHENQPHGARSSPRIRNCLSGDAMAKLPFRDPEPRVESRRLAPVGGERIGPGWSRPARARIALVRHPNLVMTP